MPNPSTSGATATSKAVNFTLNKLSAPYVQINAHDNPTRGKATSLTERKVKISKTTTTTRARITSNARLSNVPLSIS